MTSNVGNLDRIIRIALALIIAAVIVTGAVTGTAALVLGIMAAVLLLTGLIRFCPAYRLLGVSSCGRR